MVSFWQQQLQPLRQRLCSGLEHLRTHHGGNRRSLWLLLAGLLFTWSALQLYWIDVDPSFQLLNLLIWFGCTIALEDQLPLLWPPPPGH